MSNKVIINNNEKINVYYNMNTGEYTVETKDEILTFLEMDQLNGLNKYDLVSKPYGIGYTLNDNKEFYFDLEDYEKIKRYRWVNNDQNYIVADFRINGMKHHCRLHRLLFDLRDKDNMVVDHINHNPLDNRKENLRIVTPHKNSLNHIIAKNNTSGTTGVTWHKIANKWRAYIRYNDKQIHLGLFEKYEDAVKARKDAEDKYFGEFKNNYQ